VLKYAVGKTGTKEGVGKFRQLELCLEYNYNVATPGVTTSEVDKRLISFTFSSKIHLLYFISGEKSS